MDGMLTNDAKEASSSQAHDDKRRNRALMLDRHRHTPAAAKFSHTIPVECGKRCQEIVFWATKIPLTSDIVHKHGPCKLHKREATLTIVAPNLMWGH